MKTTTMNLNQDNPNLCQPEYAGLPGGMRKLYAVTRIYPTSTNGDLMLIRSYLAYHLGLELASRVSIKPSRGHSYRVAPHGTHGKDDRIVRIVDYYDHREGVTGYWE